MAPAPTTGADAAAARLLEAFAARRPAALARVISIVENHRAGFDDVLSALHPRTGQTRRIGITGPPGAGKSTLATELIHAYRAQGLTVGVVAVDPTSPFTGGALLGDRIRMEAVALDPGVYIRSLATRGALGGLSAATREVADVLDAFGFDRVIVETVGVGQSELDVAGTVDTSVVMLVPESGDSIQTLKAGLMEIADLFVINKADRPGADRLRTEVRLMLKLRSAGPWTPPVLGAVAAQGTGIAEIVTALDAHYEYLTSTGLLADRRRRRLRERVRDVVEQKIRARLWSDPDTTAWLDGQLPALESGRSTPYDVADALLSRSAALLTGESK